jgi:hypothetical protein
MDGLRGLLISDRWMSTKRLSLGEIPDKSVGCVDMEELRFGGNMDDCGVEIAELCRG